MGLDLPPAVPLSPGGSLPPQPVPRQISEQQRVENLRSDLGLTGEPISHLVRELHQMVRELLPSTLGQRMSAPIGLGGNVDNEQAISVTFRDSQGRSLIPSPRAFTIQERQVEANRGTGQARGEKVVTTAILVRQQMPDKEAFEIVDGPVDVVVVDDRTNSGALRVHYIFGSDTIPEAIFQNMINPGSTARELGAPRTEQQPEIQDLLLRRRPAAPKPPDWSAPTPASKEGAAFSLARDLVQPLLTARLQTIGVPSELCGKIQIQSVARHPQEPGVVVLTHRVPYFPGRPSRTEELRARLKIDPSTGMLTAAILG